MKFHVLKNTSTNDGIVTFINNSLTDLGFTDKKLPDTITYQITVNPYYVKYSNYEEYGMSLKLPSNVTYNSIDYTFDKNLNNPRLIIFGDTQAFYLLLTSVADVASFPITVVHINVNQRLYFSTTTTSNVYSGSNVQINVSDASQFLIGTTATIIGTNNNCSFTISNINYQTNTLTANYLAYSFSSGSYVAYVPVPYLLLSTQSTIPIYPQDIAPMYLQPTIVKPLYNYLHTLASSIYTTTVSDDFYQFICTNVIDEGIVSSGSDTTITDTSKSWEQNALVGKYVVFTKTLYDQYNQVYYFDAISKITANTNNTLTIMETYYQPSSGDAYVISDAFYRRITPTLFMEHTFDNISVVNDT